MSSDLREQIYGNMDLKDTEELLGIWQTNDRVEWTGEAFDVIRQILMNRGADITEQDEPIYEYPKEEAALESYGFTDEELEIIEAEDQPVFYDPLEILYIKKRIEQAAIASVVLIVLSTAFRFPELQNLTKSYLQAYPPLISLAFPLTVISATTAIFMLVITTCFPLKALARILRILMEMEFTSRIAK